MKSEISRERLERCYCIAAKIVQLYGDKYLAGFIRLKEELNRFEAIDESKRLAMKVANNYDSNGINLHLKLK